MQFDPHGSPPLDRTSQFDQHMLIEPCGSINMDRPLLIEPASLLIGRRTNVMHSPRQRFKNPSGSLRRSQEAQEVSSLYQGAFWVCVCFPPTNFWRARSWRRAPTGFLFRAQCLSLTRFELQSNDSNCSNQPLPIHIFQPKSLFTDARTIPAWSMSHCHFSVNGL